MHVLVKLLNSDKDHMCHNTITAFSSIPMFEKYKNYIGLNFYGLRVI